MLSLVPKNVLPVKERPTVRLDEVFIIFRRTFVEGAFVMSADIYGPCPCGSGKKFKFCCHAIADEMDRIVRLIDSNQPRVAVQQLEILETKRPNNAWVGTTRGMLLLDLNESAAARDVLKQVLESHPDNELAIVLYAAAMLHSEGPVQAKRAMHRAFQRSAKKLPGLVSDLATTLAAVHAQAGHMMAVREHLALALRLAPEQRRQDLFVQLLEIDGADEIAYPIRGSHHLPNIAASSDELQKEIRKGQKYAAVGCWSIAADVFLALAKASPEQPEYWHATGLCRAWDGDETAAAESLHRAAHFYLDLGIAVECETLAQILDAKLATDVIEECVYRGRVSSVSRLLTVLDGQPRVERIKVPEDGEPENRPVAGYVILDLDPKQTNFSQLTLDNVPKVLGKVVIHDADPKTNKPAFIMVAGLRGPNLENAKSTLASGTADLIEWDQDPTQPHVVGMISKESEILENHWYLPQKMPLVRRRELLNQFWHKVAIETWPQTPLKALQGKTPEQASKDSSLKVPLLAAVHILDASAQQRERGIGLTALFARLGIEPLPVLGISGETGLGSLSIMQLNRLPIEQLNDQQLVTVVNRSMLIRHDETLYKVLKLAIARPAIADQVDCVRILRTLAGIASANGQREEMFEWINRGRNLPAPEGKTAFQNAWAWDMTEFGARLEDPSDPQLKPLLNRFVTYYGPKVPQIRQHIEQTLLTFDIPSPWSAVEIITPDTIPSIGGGWNPSAPQTVPAAGKIWLPGQ